VLVGVGAITNDLRDDVRRDALEFAPADDVIAHVGPPSGGETPGKTRRRLALGRAVPNESSDDGLDVRRLGPFRTLLDVVGDLLALRQRLEAFAVDGREVNEDFNAVFALPLEAVEGNCEERCRLQSSHQTL
jgi:hypothetical protein